MGGRTARRDGGRITRAAWLGATLLALTACAADSSSRQGNLERCLADDPYCDASLLSAGEQQQVFEARSRQHLRDCLAGWRCNEAALTAEERQRVQASVALLNFGACLKGAANCRNDLLNDEERIEVERAAALRNVELCMSGLTACNEVALTDSQRAAAWQAYSDRNFAGCMNAVGTLVSCNRDDLSAEQNAQVDRRNLAVNLYVCTNSLLGCNPDLLTPEQRDRIAAIRAAQAR